MKFTTYKCRHPFDRRAGFTHAYKGGAPVLIEDSSWKTINGIFFNIGSSAFLFEFRRVWR